jgi:hypothetical protein
MNRRLRSTLIAHIRKGIDRERLALRRERAYFREQALKRLVLLLRAEAAQLGQQLSSDVRFLEQLSVGRAAQIPEGS